MLKKVIQGLVKGAKLCFRYPYFYFRHGESNSTASQKSKDLNNVSLLLQDLGMLQALVKGVLLCFRNPYFYFRHGESTSTARQLTSPASQKKKDLNKVSLLLQDLGLDCNAFACLLESFGQILK